MISVGNQAQYWAEQYWVEKVNNNNSGTDILVCVVHLNTAPTLTDKNVCATNGSRTLSNYNHLVPFYSFLPRISMKKLFTINPHSFVLPTLMVLLGIVFSSCGQLKQDKEKYHSEIKVVVDKAERNAEFVAKLLNENASNAESLATQIANLTAGVEALDKFSADLKIAKSELAKVSTPKFEDFSLKNSTERWFDVQIQGTADMKAAFVELNSIMKGFADIEAKEQQAQADEEDNDNSLSEERKVELLKQLEGMNIDKRFRDIETTMHNAKNEVLTNEEKFIMQNELKVTKFVVGNL